jgi:streptogramin lyase
MKSGQNLISTIKETKSLFTWLIAGFIILGITIAAYAYVKINDEKQKHQGWITFDELIDATTLAMDPQGRVWAANKNFTVIEPLTGNTFEWPYVPNSIFTGEYDEMKSMVFDHDGRLWIHTSNIPLAFREPNGVWVMAKPETVDDEEEAKSIQQIIVDGRGWVWLRSFFNLGVINPQGGNKTYTFQGSDCYMPDGADVDRHGRLWITCDHSLKMLDENNEWVIMAELPVTPQGGIIIDSNDQVWVGNQENIQMIWPEKNRHTYDILNAWNAEFDVDQYGRLWVEGPIVYGLFKIDPINDNVAIYDSFNSGLASQGINDILVDSENQVWVATFEGISVLNPNAELAPETIQETTNFVQDILLAASVSIGLLITLSSAFLRPGKLIRVNIRKFALGFAGWFGFFSLFWLASKILNHNVEGGYIFIYYLQVLSIIAVLILLAIKRNWLSLGVISAIIVNAIFLILLNSFGISSLYYWTPFFLIPYN